MPPKHDDEVQSVEPTKRKALSNADIIPDAGKVHLGKLSSFRRRSDWRRKTVDRWGGRLPPTQLD